MASAAEQSRSGRDGGPDRDRIPGRGPDPAAEAAPISQVAAYRLLERLRWHGAPWCPRCGLAGRCYLLRPADGHARRTRSGNPTSRRVWKCGACRSQFSVLVGTIMQGTRLPLPTWVAVLRDWRPAAPLPSPARLRSEHGISSAAADLLRRRLELLSQVFDATAAATWVDGGRDALLTRVLQLPADVAAGIRDQSPSRARRPRQCGPSADYGN